MLNEEMIIERDEYFSNSNNDFFLIIKIGSKSTLPKWKEPKVRTYIIKFKRKLSIIGCKNKKTKNLY